MTHSVPLLAQDLPIPLGPGTWAAGGALLGVVLLVGMLMFFVSRFKRCKSALNSAALW